VLQRAYSHWLAIVVISLAGVGLRAPLLHTGFIVDDYAQLAMMTGTYPVQRDPLSLFTFSSGEPAENQALKDAGFFPWWSHPDVRVSLFRPLASALMWLDHLALRDDALLFHVHSALWWLGMSVMLGVLLRRFLPPGWALFAHAMCVVHPANGMLLGWVANRNASVALLFAASALYLQVTRRGTWRIPACWALSLLAGEYGASFLVICAAYDLTATDSWRAKWSRLRPCVWVLLGYVVLRSALHVGSRESGMYVDPVGEPLAFLRTAAGRGPAMVADLVLGMRSNWWSAGYPIAEPLRQALQLSDAWVLDLRPMRTLHVAVGLFASVIAAWVAWFSQRHEPALRFAALALPFAILPTLGGAPESRLLLTAAFGWSLLLAQALRALSVQLRQQSRARTLLALGALLALSAWEVQASIRYSAEDRAFLPRVAQVIRSAILAPALDQTLAQVEDAFLVSAVDPTTTIYIPMLRRWHGHVGPQRCHLLMSTLSPFRLDRIDATQFRLSRLQQHYTPPDVYAEAFRREPMQVGQSFAMTGLQATVEQVHDGMPVVVRYATARDLDSPASALLMQTANGVEVLRFPAVGQSLMLPGANFPFAQLAAD
jgi:hypothetical protein